MLSTFTSFSVNSAKHLYKYWLGCLVLFVLLHTGFSFAQTNLILNGSFEDTVCCPSNGQKIYCTPPWFYPTQGDPEYFHVCAAPGGAGVPPPTGYYLYPYTGQSFAGFYTFQAGSNGRDYVEYPIPGEPLLQDKRYCVGFYVCLANGWAPIDNLHAYLSTDSIINDSVLVLPYQPQIKNPIGNIIDDTLNWTLVSDYYIANGGERFITIGNFYPDSLTNLGAGWGPLSISYYYIDNVFIYDCDSGESVSEITSNELQMTIYPNPVSDDFTLETDIKQAGEVTITVTDYLGRKVEEIRETRGTGKYRKTIITKLFAKGEYSVTVKTKDGTAVRKIVVQ